MKSIRILASSALAISLVSCASQKADPYDTANPYGSPDAGQANPPASAPANPVYDTPAAYEESSATPAAPSVTPEAAAVPAAPAAPANGAAIIHTVVAGDTLSGISSKYKVPIASIKQANRMTSDVVVLGRKMVIPSR